jgi:cell wall-associated NlpC family hydrolase
MNDEESLRSQLAAEALSWVGTPYVSNGMIKGRRGGVDCAMILIGIYQNVGLVPKSFDPRPYPAQWHLHQSEERYLNQMLNWAVEVPGPPERKPLPGDIVLFKLGKVFSHSAIIISWPIVVHAMGNDRVIKEDLSKRTEGKRAFWTLPMRFFSYWKA